MKKAIIILVLIFGANITFGQSIEDYYKIAADNNPGLKAKFKHYQSSIENIAQANSLPDPTLSFGYFIQQVETKTGPQQAKLSLTQMFPWFGTLKSKGDIQANKAEANFQSFMDARNKLFFQIASNYYPLYELVQFIKIEEENLRILSSYLTIAKKKYENGESSMVDVLRVQLMMDDSKTNLEVLTAQKTSLVTTFNKILNRNEDEFIEIVDTLILDKQLEILNAKDSLLNNPKLHALDYEIKAAEQKEKYAIKSGLPKIGLGLDYVFVGDPGQNINNAGKDIIMPMISISIPIFRSKYNAARKQAQLEKENYQLQKDQLSNQLITEYDFVQFQINKQNQLIKLYLNQIQTTNQSLKLLYMSYANSGKDFEEVLRMEQQLLKYKKLEVSSVKELKIAESKLNYLTAKKI